MHTDWRRLLGPSGVIDDPAAMAPYLSEWRGLYQGQALLVARPSSLDQVIAVVQHCRSEGLAIIPKAATPVWSGALCRVTHRAILSFPWRR